MTGVWRSLADGLQTIRQRKPDACLEWRGAEQSQLVKRMKQNGTERRPGGDGPGGRQAGFSLVEVLVAAGITGGILIAIAGLFVLGGQKVKGGRCVSAATTVAQSVLEEIRGLRADEIYGLLDGQPTDPVRAWNTDQANPVWTEANLNNTDKFTEILDKWRAAAQEELPSGRIGLTVEGFLDRPRGGNDGTSTFGGARFLRVTVTVFWRESRDRGRRVTMELIKF